MVRRVTAPRVMAVADAPYPQSHTANVERRTSEGFVDIPEGASVAPSEPIRYSSAVGAGFLESVTFRVYDATGALVFEKTDNIDLTGNAKVDTLAPSTEGIYIVEADWNRTFLRDHSDFTTFRVDVNAPPPPPPPPGGGFGGGFIPDVGDLKTLGYIALAGGGLILALQLVGAARTVTRS